MQCEESGPKYLQPICLLLNLTVLLSQDFLFGAVSNTFSAGWHSCIAFLKKKQKTPIPFSGSRVQNTFLLLRVGYICSSTVQRNNNNKKKQLSEQKRGLIAEQLFVNQLATWSFVALSKENNTECCEKITPNVDSPSRHLSIRLSVSSRSAPPAAVETRSHHGRAHPTAAYQQEWESGKQRITRVTLCRLPPKHPPPPPPPPVRPQNGDYCSACVSLIKVRPAFFCPET